MRTFALINDDNIVSNIIVVEDSENVVQWLEATFSQTAVEVFPNDEDVRVRGFMGGVYFPDTGYIAPPKPFSNWVMHSTDWDWEAPTPMPEDGNDYVWNDDTASWELLRHRLVWAYGRNNIH